MATQVQEHKVSGIVYQPRRTFDVVIPARNEEQSIGRVLTAFADYGGVRREYQIGRVIVVIDDATTDDTAEMVLATRYTRPVEIMRKEGVKGKGQCVSYGTASVSCPWVMICDADWLNLTPDHIASIAETSIEMGTRGMVIGVPEYPRGVPDHVISSWPWVSGFRMFPRFLIGFINQPHGYLLETQLNTIAAGIGMDIVHLGCDGAISPFTWPLPDWRLQELKRDRLWGIWNGWLRT